MDENLINQTTEDIEYDAKAVHEVVVEQEPEVVVDISESMGWVSGDNRYHDSLLGTDYLNQHPISAITGLRDELDEIESLKSVESNKFNSANYYKWSYGSRDTYGYFVSITPGGSTIDICGGADIFGVTVSDAGFIGGQNDVKRDNTYSLVVTSGLVDVRCELDVDVGDYVVSNSRGCAEKTEFGYGYKVISTEIKHGDRYAVIMLGVQADVTSAIGEMLNDVENRVSVNETNITAAINVANQAYNKAGESAAISDELIEKVKDAVINSQNAVDDVKSMNDALTSASAVAAQAKAIAESAVTSAESMRKEAMDSANETASKIKDLTVAINPLTKWTDEKTGNSGASYLVDYIDNGLATKVEIEDVETDLEYATSAIQRNAKSLQTLVVSIDKHSVGKRSQADGMTQDQAASVLENGMIYVPTEQHEESSYTGEFPRTFTPGYLYQWGALETGMYGWITVDKDYKQTTESAADEKSEVNTSSMAVYFSNVEIMIGGNNNYGYWYTNGDNIQSTPGTTYEPYTLYKWINKEEEEEVGHWLAVATLNGNVNNRSISQIRQDANSIVAEVVNAYGAVAGFGAKLSETDAKVNSIASWPTGSGTHNMAIFEQKADADGAYMTLAAVRDVNGGPEITELGGAKIILNDSELGSFIKLDADSINFGESVKVTNSDEEVMNVADKFIVDRQGNVRLSGSIVWGIDSKPTQVVYCSVYKEPPANKTMWSEFPESSEDDWHQVWDNNTDYYGSYTYDGGTTWGEPIRLKGENGKPGTGVTILGNYDTEEALNTAHPTGNDGDAYLVDGNLYVWSSTESRWVNVGNIQGPQGGSGDTIKVAYAYYAKSGSSIPDTKPTNGSGVMPDGWSITPYDATASTPYVFVSQCIITNGRYGDWSTPTCWAKYGKDGDDASVTAINMFNAVTENGTKPGCFVLDNGKLAINATYIKSGQIDSNLVLAGEVVAKNINATGGYIGNGTSGFEIGNNAIYNKYTLSVSDGISWATHMKSPTELSTGLYCMTDETSSFVYVGTDGVGTIKYTNLDDVNNDGAVKHSSYMANGSLFSNNAEITGKITAISGDFSNVVFNTGSIGGIQVVPQAICDNAAGLMSATWGITSADAYVGYDSLSIDLSGGISCDNTSSIRLFAGASGLRNGAPSNTSNVNFYVTNSGLVNAKNIFCNNGIIALQTASYDTYFNQGQVVIRNRGSNYSVLLTASQLQWKNSDSNKATISFNTNSGSASLGGTWYGTSAQAISSWRGGKHDIEAIDDRYSTLIDNLRPVRFKYNDGESDRYHIGFILDELKDAMDVAEVDSSEFAAYCVDNVETGEGGIRYEEIVSLNTFEIQKLKSRVAELENKIVLLTTEK